MTDSDEPEDDDAAANAIIERMRRRLRKKNLEAQERAVVEAQDAAALSAIVQPGWGFAARAAALRRIQKGRSDAASRLRAAIDQANRMQEGSATVTQNVLTDPDFLWSFFLVRMPSPDEPVTDEAFHAFASCASVCTAWRDAVAPLIRPMLYLRHGRQLRPPPPPSPYLDQPSFCELAPTGELVVCESHQIALLSRPSPVPRARWTRLDLTRGGSAAGEVYYPHGCRCSEDGRHLYVADRSNQRVQCLRMHDAKCMHTTRDEHYTPRLLPYGLALWRNQLFVADAATDQVLVLDATALGNPPTRALGGGQGDAPGCLGSVRGVALWHLDADSHRPSRRKRPASAAGEDAAASLRGSGGRTLVMVAEFSNNRVSVFGTGDDDDALVCTFGDVASPGGALPLRRPYDVLHAHGLLIVSEYDGKRLCCFAADEGCTPLQILSPPQCGALSGLACDGSLIYALDANRGRIHFFGVVEADGDEAPLASPRGEGGGGGSTASSPTDVRTPLRQRLLQHVRRSDEHGVCDDDGQVTPRSPSSGLAGTSFDSNYNYDRNTSSNTNYNRNPIRDPHILMLRPNLEASRATFLAGYPITLQELDALSEQSAERAAIDKAEVDALRELRGRAGDASLTEEESARIAKSDAEKARILRLAEEMAAGLSFLEQPRTFDPFGRFTSYQ